MSRTYAGVWNSTVGSNCAPPELSTVRRLSPPEPVMPSEVENADHVAGGTITWMALKSLACAVFAQVQILSSYSDPVQKIDVWPAPMSGVSSFPGRSYCPDYQYAWVGKVG